MTDFTQLNLGWNADPNAPLPQVSVEGCDVMVQFRVNAFQFPQFTEGDSATLRFRGCGRFRFGATNDEGWYMGQCRFSDSAPAWGNFYEVTGDAVLLLKPDDWRLAQDSQNDSGKRHYLFYFKDETFECTAEGWDVRLPKAKTLTAQVQLSDSA